MKVIFLADVPNVARVGQTREVADGYARNYLFPRKLAVLADSQKAVSLEAHLKKLVKQREIEDAEMAELAKKITGVELTLTAKVGENDKLYGSITAADIAGALTGPAGREIDKKIIALHEPIKQAGMHDVTVRFTHEITAVVKVNVVPEGGVEEKPDKEKKAEKAGEAPVAEAEAPVEKKAKKEKKEKPAKEEPAAAEAVAEKPAKEKKAKAEKPAKEEKTEKTEDKKEKKSKKAQKEDAAAE